VTTPLRGLFSSAGLGTLTHEHASTYLHLLGLAACRPEFGAALSFT
jgi:hypothetical protein